jgi:AcrR family transcriptional regulator
MAAAAQLFARHGYHAVGINDISGELGLTGPAFYRHYPSKEAL